MPEEAGLQQRHKKKSLAKHGMSVQPLTEQLAKKLHTRSKTGVVVKNCKNLNFKEIELDNIKKA